MYDSLIDSSMEDKYKRSYLRVLWTFTGTVCFPKIRNAKITSGKP